MCLSVKLKLSCLYVHSFYLRQPASQGKDLKSEWKAIPQSFIQPSDKPISRRLRHSNRLPC